MIDANVYLGRYPFRRLPADEPAILAATLRQAGVTEAWTCSLDALLHRDLGSLNARLVDDCRVADEQLFLPFGAINPAEPGWETDFQHCVEKHAMRGLRLFPAYHGYDFQLPQLRQLLTLASQTNRLVQIVWRVEDERTEHPLLRPGNLDVRPLIELVAAFPNVPIMLLNAHRDVRLDAVTQLIRSGNVSFDLATLEGVGGIERWVANHSAQRLVFGSYAPVFVHAAAQLKLQESELPQPIREAITQGNARRLLA